MNGELGAENRISHLDGLRGLAILMVLGFHYFSLYADSSHLTYPYGDGFADFILFEYGHYGVQLFFAISGFVIGLTLDRCGGPLEFAVRRFSRLWPTMLLCSVLTYAVLTIWPAYWPQSAVNFLPSLTFLDGMLWNQIIPGLNAGWIDGSYWSLFVEVRFYILAAVIFYFSRSRFAWVFTIFSIIVVGSYLTALAYLSMMSVGAAQWFGLWKAALIPGYLPWFLIGVAAQSHYRGYARESISIVVIALGMLTLFAMYLGAMRDLIAGVGVAVLVFAPFYSSRFAALLCQPWLVKVGIASYSLYLLHQNAGLTLISVAADHLGLTGAAALVLVILISGVLIVISRIIYRYWESPLNKRLVFYYSGIGANLNRSAA